MFPPGERFFIQSVQHYRDRISDPVLMEEVKRFTYQEAMHTREHEKCNAALIAQFPEGKDIQDLAANAIRIVRRVTPKSTHLAATCALEHCTAIFAHSVLRMQEYFITFTHPSFAALWLWHAVEEAEHKAVCFDVYQAVCGKSILSYLHRILVMFLVSLIFMAVVAVALHRMKKKNRSTTTLAATLSSAQPMAPAAQPEATAPLPPRRNLGFFAGLRDLVPAGLYFDYYRPSFHPWNHDNRQLIEQWKQRFKDFGLDQANPQGALCWARRERVRVVEKTRDDSVAAHACRAAAAAA